MDAYFDGLEGGIADGAADWAGGEWAALAFETPFAAEVVAAPEEREDSVDGSSGAAVEDKVVRGNVSHTRRCRAKVNTNFDRLLEALPDPPEGVEVKHKAQILSYAIETFHVVRYRNATLEMQLAMSSPYHMNRWVNSVVQGARTLTDALKPFMALICMTRKWKYAELWTPESVGTGGTSLKYVKGLLVPTIEGEELSRLKHYRMRSRKYTFRPRMGVPGRVFLTMRPEWLPCLKDKEAFPRAPHAIRHKVEVTFAVPVIVNGSVQMVVEFYDTSRRDYDPEVLNIANEIAAMFGKQFDLRDSAPKQPCLTTSIL